jgi:hypothetical protein
MVIFDDNVFEGNVGLVGGAVSIDTPNFNISDYSSRFPVKPWLRPATVFHKNVFERNQAYWSGNAVHLRSRRLKDAEDEENQVCGGGFHLQYNQFVNNSAVLVSTTGGAVSVECDWIDA